jgi:hypothetical protein
MMVMNFSVSLEKSLYICCLILLLLLLFSDMMVDIKPEKVEEKGNDWRKLRL